VLDRNTGVVEPVSDTSSTSSQFGAVQAIGLSDDGRYILYSTPDAAVPDDTNGVGDVYVRDRVRGRTFLAVRSATGAIGNRGAPNGAAAISADGRNIAFQSPSSNLVGHDTNGVDDVFVRSFPEPEPTAATPSSVARGTSTTFSLSGQYLLSSSLVAISGNGVNVDSVVWNSEQQLTVSITVAADAPTGPRSVQVTLPGTGPGSGAGATGVCAGCLTIT
jgi:Tol biopolymer transport system component